MPDLELAPHSQLFPVDNDTATRVLGMLVNLNEGELGMGRDSQLGMLEPTSPVGYLLHFMSDDRRNLRALDESTSADADKRPVQAYRVGVFVGSLIVRERALTLTEHAGLQPIIEQDITGRHFRLPGLPNLRAQQGVNTDTPSVLIAREAEHFRRYFEDNAATTLLNATLRSLWQLRRFEFMTHPDAARYTSLGLQDTFKVYETLSKATDRPEPAEATVAEVITLPIEKSA